MKTYIQLKELPCSPVGTEWTIPKTVNNIAYTCYWPKGVTTATIEATCYSPEYIQSHPEFWKEKEMKREPKVGKSVWFLTHSVTNGFSAFDHVVRQDDLDINLFKGINFFWFTEEEAKEAISQINQLLDFLQKDYTKNLSVKK